MFDRLRALPDLPWKGLLLAATLLQTVGCTPSGRATDPSGVDTTGFIDVSRSADADAPTTELHAPCLDEEPCRRTVVYRGKEVAFYASRSIFEPSTKIEHAVILVHGIDASARRNFATLVASARRAASSGIDASVLGTTILIAPHFPSDATSERREERHRWRRANWSSGGDSVTAPGVSSFAVIDQLVAELSHPGRFPNLRTIVVAGHSAGGQVAQRYAATSAAEDALPRGVTMRYVVANPSSFLYLRPERPFFDAGQTGFGIPYRGSQPAPGFGGAPSCPDGYDQYRYGLQHPNAYVSRAGIGRIVAQYPRRDVLVLIGQYDTIGLQCAAPDAPPRCRELLARNLADLDQSCPARLQGVDRHARADRWREFMDQFFPGHRQRSLEVPGANHSSRAMFDSPEGAQALFGGSMPAGASSDLGARAAH